MRQKLAVIAAFFSLTLGAMFLYLSVKFATDVFWLLLGSVLTAIGLAYVWLNRHT
jgi:hypothetical protein